MSLRAISRKEGISESCGRKWKKQYENMGSLAKRRVRPNSSILGRKSRVSKSTCKMLVLPTRNPVRKQPLDAQLAYHNIPVSTRQMERLLKKHTNKGGRYLCAFIKKIISKKNREERRVYGEEHVYDALFSFFDYIVYTNKAHINPTSQAQGRVLREQGTRYNTENIKERPPLKGVRFYIIAWISWYSKAKKLEFYNNEEDVIETPPYPPKPRRRPTTETEEEYKQRVLEWEAGKPYSREVKV